MNEHANKINSLNVARLTENSQKIIFTHEIGFLCKYYKMFKRDSNNLKVLKISNSLSNGSSLDVCDIENEFLKDNFFKDLEYIKDAVENSRNIDESLKKVRLCMEHLLKRGVDTYYEIGSGSVLLGLLKRIDRQATRVKWNSPS